MLKFGQVKIMVLSIPPDALTLVPWIYENTMVLERIDGEDGGVELTVQMTTQARKELRRRAERYPALKIS